MRHQKKKYECKTKKYEGKTKSMRAKSAKKTKNNAKVQTQRVRTYVRMRAKNKKAKVQKRTEGIQNV